MGENISDGSRNSHPTNRYGVSRSMRFIQQGTPVSSCVFNVAKLCGRCGRKPDSSVGLAMQIARVGARSFAVSDVINLAGGGSWELFAVRAGDIAVDGGCSGYTGGTGGFGALSGNR